MNHHSKLRWGEYFTGLHSVCSTTYDMYTYIHTYMGGCDYTVGANSLIQAEKRTYINFVHSRNGPLGYLRVISDTLIIFIKAANFAF